ncbi:MAG TPA: 50S ribosomal protein L11 methyltransferase [Chthoniobacterales bacterium]|nr:50S ribosomal protein L11 methyltransferase [Chthoniobacterales bacterium]
MHRSALESRFGDKLAVIAQPGRKRLEIQIAVNSMSRLRELVKIADGRIEKLPRDWLERFQRRDKPKLIGIKDRQLIIPAGAAFGTGEHATTAMSLHMLERLAQTCSDGWSSIDLGTGSGILALAARLFGAKPVIGIDNDPRAVSTAKQNARLNKIDNVGFRAADVRSCQLPRNIDIITANLFSELLVEILPKLRRAAWLILSGILREQERELIHALKRQKINIVQVRRRGKWVTILARGLRRS